MSFENTELENVDTVIMNNYKIYFNDEKYYQ